ncbi:hypothetical protein CLAFUW4_09500 [Fulvia fulva]|uniref:Uncharacterized protein n=1 Tax=Passalora fulva TaxID=5499 RepID=A0A9Q8UTB8_PASFU|nr:uncharacterized protein CLAFUR5_09597 [Fulvia fulva]KAK4614013.1 hypothetical protein CLAFUR4_09506 [Fulvia fulva]KAK4614898.1 hypothetical protein CLAFUR0_09497 [Fulvia fulva]UJO21668.1 hypothetical protein CLAFUR5_09597 [Fulvia fulva]WPV20727.1 hypothetical protein CLAFUW4_09500 [Fulvia fulva]WPV34864.1 hypothetical protein CLAFUW7_09501 [Fulvia fulva]
MPLRSLLIAQGINRRTRDIIKDSKLYQQALFFRPYGPGPVTVRGAEYPFMHCASEDVCVRDDPGYCMPQGRTAWKCWSCPSTGEENAFVVTNPLLPFCPGDRKNSSYLDHATFSLLLQDPVWNRPEASWRKMLITQPPLFQAIVEHRSAKHNHVFQASLGDLGITAGDCFESACAHGHPICGMVLADFVQLQETDTAGEALERMQQGVASVTNDPPR